MRCVQSPREGQTLGPKDCQSVFSFVADPPRALNTPQLFWKIGGGGSKCSSLPKKPHDVT